jgi:hypothetical protein
MFCVYSHITLAGMYEVIQLDGDWTMYFYRIYQQMERDTSESEHIKKSNIIQLIARINDTSFRYSVESILLIVKLLSFMAAVGTEFSSKKDKKSVLFGAFTVKNHFSVSQS